MDEMEEKEMFKDIETINNIALSKYTMMKNKPFKFFMKSIMAGIYLGIACILSYTLAAMFSDNVYVSKCLLAVTFGIGLVSIIFLGAELFTGNCFTTIIPIYSRKLKFKDIIPMWVVCYIGNIIGIAFICALFIVSKAQESILKDYLFNIMNTKLHFNIFELFIKGILCNLVVCCAAYAGMKIKNESAKIFVVMMLVMTFVLAGFDHCIANAGLFTMGIVQLGNLVDWSLLPLHMLISSLGNIIGGSLFLGLPIYIIFKED
jgi:nitrite transporter NirC